ncbi:MAG: cellulase family glycosylhydrolase, partial [Planctomycetota bacterium]
MREYLDAQPEKREEEQREEEQREEEQRMIFQSNAESGRVLRTLGILLACSFCMIQSVQAQFIGNNTPVISAGLGKGVNFGNMLEAPYEGAWGLVVEEIFFDKVAELGLDHIRLPVSWTHHAATTAPYTIEEDFFQRVDWCINQALARDLKIIVNNHH